MNQRHRYRYRLTREALAKAKAESQHVHKMPIVLDYEGSSSFARFPPAEKFQKSLDSLHTEANRGLRIQGKFCYMPKAKTTQDKAIEKIAKRLGLTVAKVGEVALAWSSDILHSPSDTLKFALDGDTPGDMQRSTDALEISVFQDDIEVSDNSWRNGREADLFVDHLTGRIYCQVITHNFQAAHPKSKEVEGFLYNTSECLYEFVEGKFSLVYADTDNKVVYDLIKHPLADKQDTVALPQGKFAFVPYTLATRSYDQVFNAEMAAYYERYSPLEKPVRWIAKTFFNYEVAKEDINIVDPLSIVIERVNAFFGFPRKGNTWNKIEYFFLLGCIITPIKNLVRLLTQYPLVTLENKVHSVWKQWQKQCVNQGIYDYWKQKPLKTLLYSIPYGISRGLRLYLGCVFSPITSARKAGRKHLALGALSVFVSIASYVLLSFFAAPVMVKMGLYGFAKTFLSVPPIGVVENGVASFASVPSSVASTDVLFMSTIILAGRYLIKTALGWMKKNFFPEPPMEVPLPSGVKVKKPLHHHATLKRRLFSDATPEPSKSHSSNNESQAEDTAEALLNVAGTTPQENCTLVRSDSQIKDMLQAQKTGSSEPQQVEELYESKGDNPAQPIVSAAVNKLDDAVSEASPSNVSTAVLSGP